MSKRLFLEYHLNGAPGHRLRVASLRPRGAVERVVLITPLIGARAEDQLITFRALARAGCQTFSFEFRGHGESSDPFSLENSLADTARVLGWITAELRSEAPIHLMTACYSAVPLLATLSARRTNGVRSLVGINSLFSLHEIVRPHALLELYSRRTGRDSPTRDEFLSAVNDGTIDVADGAFLELFAGYLRELFPGFRIAADRFEELEWRRADLVSMVNEYMGNRMLEGVRVPDGIPALFLYGTRDAMMRLDTEDGRRAYRARVARCAPAAAIEGLDFDHFMKGPAHRAALDRVTRFMRDHEG